MIERLRVRRAIRAAALALGLLVGFPRLADARRHDLHVSHTRAVVAGSQLVVSLRVFKDDAEKALHRPLKRDTETDEAFMAYLRANLQFRLDGRVLYGKLLQASEERDASGIVSWSAVLAYPAAPKSSTLAVSNTIFYDVYRDQQNLVAVMHEAKSVRTTLYFQPGDRSEQTVRW